MIVVNFKTYASASGEAAEALLKAMSEQVNVESATMVAAVSAFDLGVLASKPMVWKLWSQHLDPVGLGGFTGWLEPQTAMSEVRLEASSTTLNTKYRLTMLNHF